MRGFGLQGSFFVSTSMIYMGMTTHFELIGTALDEQDLEIRIRLREATCCNTSCSTSSSEDDIHIPHAPLVVDRVGVYGTHVFGRAEIWYGILWYCEHCPVYTLSLNSLVWKQNQ